MIHKFNCFWCDATVLETDSYYDLPTENKFYVEAWFEDVTTCNNCLAMLEKNPAVSNFFVKAVGAICERFFHNKFKDL